MPTQEYYKVQALDCYNDKITKVEAELELKNKDIGTYLIRESSLNQTKPQNERGYYFAISCVNTSKNIDHILIYVPDDIVALTLAEINDQPKLNDLATVVKNIASYLKINADQFKTPLVTDPNRIKSLKLEQKVKEELVSTGQSSELISLSKARQVYIFSALAEGLGDWLARQQQIVSDLHSIKETDEIFNKIKSKLDTIGIDIAGDLMFVVTSSEINQNTGLKTGRQRIVVDCNKFNNSLNYHKLGKLKETIIEQRDSYSKTLESGEVGQGRGAYMLEHHIDVCSKALEAIEFDFANSTTEKKLAF